jgi:2'-hydroxyisoflavone reductase
MTMRLLVLGGTRFVGRTVIEEAIGQGWTVTAFNRGVTGPLPEGATGVIGDRTRSHDLRILLGESFDAVVDTWAGAPRVVARAARALRSTVGHYVYVSTRSVYEQPWLPGADESAPVVPADPDAAAVSYPADKRGAELAVLRVFGQERAALLRCGLILGPYEDVGRLPWWLTRISQGGDVLAPGPASLALQFIDARDLAAFALECAERRLGDTYNVGSMSGHATMGSLLQACRAATASTARLVWADPQQLLSAGVQPWTDLPVWIPPGHAAAAMHDGDVSRALAAGLHARPADRTVGDTWAWMVRTSGRAMPTDRPPLGLSRERERDLLVRVGACNT